MYKVFLPLNLKLLQRLAQRRPDLFGTDATAFQAGGFVEKMIEMSVRLTRIEQGVEVSERDHELILDFTYDPRDTHSGSGYTPRYGYSLRSVVIARREARCPESLVNVVYHPAVSREWVAYWTYKQGSVWINHRDLLAESAKPKTGTREDRRRTPQWLTIPLPLVNEMYLEADEQTRPFPEDAETIPSQGFQESSRAVRHIDCLAVAAVQAVDAGRY